MRASLFSLTLIASTASLACSSDSDGGGSNGGAGGTSGGSGGSGATTAGGSGGSDGGSGGSVGGGSGTDQMIAELEATGIFDHLGQYTPASTETAPGPGNVTKHWFDVTPDGPQCIDSSDFGVSTRDQGSDNLVIFLMGGGACWTGFPFCTTEVTGQIDALDNDGGLGIVNPTDDGPTSSWNHMFVPYCDGSVFVGDRTADIVAYDPANPDTVPFEGDEVMHGLKNLSAALDVAKSEFPSPNRILLAGTSAGGFGTIWATGLVRKLYPDAELLVFNDAGIGIVKESDPTFRTFLESEWGAEDRFPESCTECKTSAHVIPIVSWGLERDPNLWVSAFTSYGDDTIAGVFLNITDEEFETSIRTETDKIHEAFPDRFKRFFIEGGQHTALGGWTTTQKDGKTLKEWTVGMVEGDDTAWTDMP